MTKIKLMPLPKVDLSEIEIKGTIEVHASRLASFKATVSRYNKDNGTKYKFSYGGFKSDYCIATRTA